MKTRPIIFSAPMVRAILGERKTQTRRMVRPCDCNFFGSGDQKDDPSAWGYAFDGPDHHGYAVLARGYDERHDHGSVSIPCPYGVPGDRLWVREIHQAFWIDDLRPDLDFTESNGAGWRVRYPATDGLEDMHHEEKGVGAWCRPSIHMPRWASRITLTLTDVRVQRLQDITEEDAHAEGVDPMVVLPGDAISHVAAFAMLWDSINHARAPWDSNPWVWALTFERLK